MSDDNNLGTNSICITEDEFEQFQAGTMYEEDEFITLSDIVPPQPDVPDLSTELSEIPYDNEVELSSSLNDDANHVNSTVEPNQNKSVELAIQSYDGQHVSEEQGTSTFDANNLSKPAKANKNQKVGRRKKKANENDPIHQNDIQNDTYMDHQAIQDSGLSTTVGTNSNDSKSETRDVQKLPRRTRRERIPNTSKYSTVYETALSETTSAGNTQVRRRGRPPKAPLNISSISEPDSTNNDSTSHAQEESNNSGSFETGNPSKTSEVRRGRRGRPKKLLPSHDASQSADHSSNNISETENNMPFEDIKKTNCRRGRKKMSKTIETPVENSDTVPMNNEDLTVELPIPSDTHIIDNSTLDKPSQETQVLNGEIMQEETLHNSDDMELENDDADDICLSKLKESIQCSNADSKPIEADNIQNVSSESNDTTTKRNAKMPIMADFEYNIDEIVKEASIENTPEQSLLVEDTSKRPNRRKAKQNLKYDEGSDEDPFANVELSDDDEPRNRKKGRYDDDDEYIPRKKRGMTPVSSESDSDINEGFEDGRKQKRKRLLFNNLSPKKRGKNSKIDVLLVDDCINEDIDISKTSSTVQDEPLSMKPPAEAWATSNEFENFIAQKIQGTSLKIQKLSSKKNSEPAVAPIKIPVIDQNERKKSVDIFTQTVRTVTATTGSQTSAPYDLPMKANITLSSEQSENACKFLNSVVNTTVELGQLMKDKSESFMQKKINTDNVTDTFKMDYCVRKSFLLFKLAKHNLMQMEEDLAKQYDEFLKSNDLSACRENIKKVAPTAKAESDSDCEIVDVKQNPVKKQTEKPKFNPKTVFLNKELSIKIAKKPTADKNIDIKGRHTVWINDSVMVKKVKPTQSFLAQDSRNKKPPDNLITEKMVSDFFKNYHRQQALAVCAPYLNTQWSGVHKEYACYYFVNCNGYECDTSNTDLNIAVMHNNNSTPNENYDITASQETTDLNNPKSLSALCTEVVHCCMHESVKEENQDMLCNLTDGKKECQPLTLSQLCIQSILSEQENKISTTQNTANMNVSMTVKSLKTLSYRRLVGLISTEEIIYDHDAIDNFQVIYENYEHNANAADGMSEHLSEFEDDFVLDKSDDHSATGNKLEIKGSYKLTRSSGSNTHVESLLSLCLKTILRSFKDANSAKNKDVETSQPFINTEGRNPKIILPMSLKVIACDRLKQLMYGKNNSSLEINHVNEVTEDFTINSVNTMSEEAFHRLEEPNEFQDEDVYDYEPDNDFDHNEENENEWASHVQMQELRSCNTPVINSIQTEFANMNNDDDNQFHETQESIHESLTLTTRIKLEPLYDVPENVVDPSIVKTEPVHGLDGMTIIPESVVTKTEMIEHVGESGDLVGREGTAYDVNTFEQFVRSNKMIRSMDDFDNDEQIFTQRGLRIKRQHEPDYDAENDMNMSLLIPHTFEPLHIESAKGDLMESSSDGEGKDSAAKKGGKKKLERKKKPQKKVKEIIKNKETTNTKDVPSPVKDLPVPIKEKVPVINEVAILTRRMREKIRQEEKKIESSDSETENIALSLRKDKSKKIESCVSDTNDIALRKDKNKKGAEKNKQKKIEQGESSKVNNTEDIEIQCNNVDSTEQILEYKDKTEEDDKFMGFSSNPEEISSYQNFLQSLYEKIIPEDDSMRDDVSDSNVDNMDNSRANTPLINPDEPVELLECVPTMPIFDNNSKRSTKRLKNPVDKMKEKHEVHKPVMEKDPEFTERYGWHCYSVDKNDAKLYQGCHIPLEKLPESFVETYLEYHDITNRDNEDKEVDRLINLQTLNRANIKEGKSKRKRKGIISSDNDVSEQDSKNVSRAPSPAHSDRLDELTPSEDEGANIEDELPPLVTVRSTENCIAKTSLMDDNDSESDGGTKKIKQELIDTEPVDMNRKPGPKSRTRMKQGLKPADVPAESLMLTADKVMNKELMLLHAPVTLKEEVKETILPKEPIPGLKIKKKSSRTTTSRDRNKPEEDDSSSEEEKQWVSTKEKLLKRLGKKEDASADDAKRAKIVDDFIVRRGDGPGKRHKRSSGRRSRKKILERLKQERFLSKELYGESSMDATPGGKRGANSGLFKGRRNIRKVIDKKSLQKSTVLANMEEFERKRRLNARQTQLRELLGFEEGVNVVVINDEVCLEYDFLEQRPVVTVHPFFTKVMKAHQYEGVKFMWDACFESLQSIEENRPGGGCILAHCMGLGKTLQVLALLHTVLTHPRAGMQRVLVCCPLSTVLNWVDEIHKWIGPVTDQIKVFELSKLKKIYERAYQLEDWYNGGGIFIIGYELFRSLTTLDPMIDDVRPKTINKIRTALLNPGPDIIICDEGHLLKNDCSVLAVAMSRVVTKRRIVLTGTPMQNNLREYYCMVNFVKPNLLGTYSEYSNRFENPIMNGQHRDSSEEDIKLMKARTHILHKVLEGCLQRQEASVLYPYLPKKHEYTVFIPLTKCQWDLYKHYVNHYSKENNKQSVLKDFHILQKIWSHPQVLHNFQIKARDDSKKKEVKAEKLEDDLALEDKEDIKPAETEVWWLQYLADGAMLDSLDSSNKFVAVFRILHECIALGDKVLIFSTSLFCLDALEYFLKKINNWSLGQEYYRLDGSVPAEVRQKWCREFNAEINIKTKLFLISTRAGCLGLNMTAANRVIILDTSWNPAHDIQSIFRVYRFGQKKDCYIYRLVAMGTMEQKIYERSVTKQAVACRVVDEQQIDRHYNMAELTELYRLDEFGVGVAGGVAVGVSDVALLRVARDAAVHAVHEHDSLLRGSSEQQLPEHERAAAWMQFQQEHAHKQMQNDLETHNAAQALKKLHEQQQIMEMARQQAQQLELAKQQAQVISIKTEDGPVHDTQSLLVARPEPPTLKHKKRGRKPNILNCRIPIQIDHPGPSVVSEGEEEDMVRQISNILVKHNFTQVGKGHKHIQDLVDKVRLMIQTNEPLNFENDELSASIASVLLRRKSIRTASVPSMPALTDISPDTPRRPRGRPRKVQSEPVSPTLEVPQVAEEATKVVEELEIGGRRRRKAAIVAEQQFDLLDDGASQDSGPGDVIELDDDDWHQSDNDSQPDIIFESTPAPQQKPTKRKTKQIDKPTPEDNSILLSDDDIPETNPTTAQKILVNTPTDKPITLKPVKTETEKPKNIPLHVSLLTNQNFIKIVAHTYLAGNPMLDEDAATLAAQYSTDKLLKETQSTGKPIEGGPIYDIAVKVLGIGVLKRLHLQEPVNKESTESSSNMLQLLDKNSETAKKIGPKSRTQPNTEPSEMQRVMPKLGVRPAAGVVPVSLLQRAPPAQTSDLSRADDECILPDDDEVHCVPDTPPQPPRSKDQTQPKPPTLTVKSEFRLTSGNVLSTPATAPPGKTYATISLDSDDEEPPAAPAPPPRPPVTVRALRAARQARLAAEAQKQANATAGPVPVALTGPGSQRIPLNLGQPTNAPTSVPVSAVSSPNTNPVPISLTGPDTRPVPISLTGPNLQPVPITLSRPGLRPIILTGQNARPVSMTLTGSNVQHVPLTLAMPNAQPVPVSLSGPGFRAVPVAANTGASPAMFVASTPLPVPPLSTTQAVPPTAPEVTSSAGQLHPNMYLYPVSSERVLTRVPAAQLPPGLRPPQPTLVQKMCKPGDILRLTRTGQLELVRSSNDVIHTIDDDEPAPTPPATRPSPQLPATRTPQLAAPAQKPQTAPAAAKPQPVLAPTVPPKPGKPKAQRRTRRISSSSSSESDSSRSASPDPLSILRDVVHIQAPDRKKAQKQNAAASQPAPKPPQPTGPSAGKKLDAYTKKLSDFLSESKRKKEVASQSTTLKSAPAKAAPAKAAPAKLASKPALTNLTNKSLMKSHTVRDSIDLTEPVSQPSKSGGSTSAARGAMQGPITVSGTSKNIVLDAKSKSLTNKSTVDITGQKNIQVMNVKTIPSATKLKPPDKRPAPPLDTTVKKKKTEPMTLKDFDIDDIDDIIELD